ncbi:OB-fold-containig protein [Psychromonas ossibalaenae]|uniref:OB-fold-containig protein n=1 Tax=Psychromonas ossibalaenae TaxID=444922 RepID=UPI00039F034C|nr:OB-fold-containig protein [Psychromonas ossibalaenae]
MLAFFLADFNLPYSSALAIVLGLAFIEGAGLIIGLSLGSLLDDLLPMDLDINADPNLPAGGLTAVLGWLYLKQLPFLVWLLLFLSGFGIAGLTLNFIINLPLFLSLPFALLAAVFISRLLGRQIARIIPKNESSALSNTSFSGKLATITIGRASKGNAAEAVLHDEFNQKHYVMVEPEQESLVFEQGTQVVLIEKLKSSWTAVEFTQ